ncbi:MAG: proteasome assembly chaperone family protein [Candidatus Thermoplasmatota archaeon]|nr:proteasome assembly chaperone family protein [Candidatus Thermoplasmatota archaeon]
MDDIVFKMLDTPQLKEPLFIEGLPGVGNVGKLAVEHMIDQLKMVKFAELYSKYLPPQVMVTDEGSVHLVRHDFYYHKAEGTGRDLVILTGDFQGLTPEGQYNLSHATVKLIKDLGASMIFTLGGFGVIRMVSEPSVLGAVTDPELRSKFEEMGVVFKRGEPSSGIIGASGLLLGLGALEGLQGICLMGETSGYFVDPRSARAVLEILGRFIGVEMDLSSLEVRARQIDEITSRIKEDIEANESEDRKDDLRYFG